MIFQGFAFFSPRIFEFLDRFGTGTLRLSYGLISNFKLDLQVIGIHGTMCLITWLMLRRKNLYAHVPVDITNIIIIRIIGVLSMMPFFLLGQDTGYFWTVPLFYSSLFAFMPTISFSKYKLLYVVFLSAIFSIAGSKAGVIYVLLFAYIYWAEKMNISTIIFFIFSLAVGMIITLISRGELEYLAMIGSIITWREYSWEITGLALHYIEDGNTLPFKVLLESVLTLIPASLNITKIAVTHSVPYFIAYQDAILLPEAGFYLSSLACFILDFGYAGLFLGAISHVLLLKVAIESCSRTGTMQLGLPLLIFFHYYLNGELAFYISHVIFSCFILLFYRISFIPSLKPRK
jgi:hypothetical protein